MTGRVRILLWYRVPPESAGTVTSAYHAIGDSLAGTPGLLRTELWRYPDDPGAFVVTSEWASREAFDSWERSPGHRPATAALRPFYDPERPIELLDIVSASASGRG
ncbi:antibiotic biosynthesis monooxygenase family protein [Spongiactinospora sp. TRM90649]|uniref:antibiotic biosynthesis monooxygenase family protein n=1 Tax=Spongiactinospora sp. TRM90649 TaxID=3031114 RepID=UPI0023F7FDB6|nr:antibiotic biosynthesis monooxygenase family protein [Spongiactinospora sp. TRM90649]MDF5755369.1 antibiotic biosynthesis monooxygenase [Spongiactinospora sp. TRM90649]